MTALTSRYAARTEARQRLKDLHPTDYDALRSQHPGNPNGWHLAMTALASRYPEQYRALLAECQEAS